MTDIVGGTFLKDSKYIQMMTKVSDDTCMRDKLDTIIVAIWAHTYSHMDVKLKRDYLRLVSGEL